MTPPPPSSTPARSTPLATATPHAVTATANPTIAGGLIGLWQGNNNSFYLFNIDGTWDWDQHGDRVLTASENQGRWWIEGDVFHIQDLAGKAPCPPDQVGAYQAQLSGDSLVLTVVKDDCGPRVDQTAGQYTRRPAGP